MLLHYTKQNKPFTLNRISERFCLQHMLHYSNQVHALILIKSYVKLSYLMCWWIKETFSTTLEASDCFLVATLLAIFCFPTCRCSLISHLALISVRLPKIEMSCDVKRFCSFTSKITKNKTNMEDNAVKHFDLLVSFATHWWEIFHCQYIKHHCN